MLALILLWHLGALAILLLMFLSCHSKRLASKIGIIANISLFMDDTDSIDITRVFIV